MRYQVSRFVVATDPQSGIIQHTKTGNRLLVSEETLKLLSLFSKPKTFEEVLSRTSSDENGRLEIAGFLEQLAKEKILVPEEETEERINWGVLTDKVLVESPLRTFFSCPRRSLAALEDEDIVFLGVPFDLGTTGYPGARFGPDKMRELSSDAFEYHTDIFTGKCKGWFSSGRNKTILEGVKMVDVGNVLLQVGESFERFYNRVDQVIRQIIVHGCFPVIVGGDHSCSYPILRAMKEQYGSVSVIHIDAHTDLGETIPNVSNNHGNVFTRVREENLVRHLHQFGIRGCIGKKLIAADYSLHTLEDLKRDGVEKVVASLNQSQPYYLSLDIDVLDPAFAPGTGTPITNGMTPEMLFALLSSVAGRVKLIGCDVVEVNPMLDRNNQTSELALSTIFHILSEVFR
ncbi:MAG: agmatinase [Patescibacteria group bacterium]